MRVCFVALSRPRPILTDIIKEPVPGQSQIIWQVKCSHANEWLVLPKELHHTWFMLYASYKKSLFYAECDVTNAEKIAADLLDPKASLDVEHAKQKLEQVKGQFQKTFLVNKNTGHLLKKKVLTKMHESDSKATVCALLCMLAVSTVCQGAMNFAHCVNCPLSIPFSPPPHSPICQVRKGYEEILMDCPGLTMGRPGETCPVRCMKIIFQGCGDELRSTSEVVQGKTLAEFMQAYLTEHDDGDKAVDCDEAVDRDADQEDEQQMDEGLFQDLMVQPLALLVGKMWAEKLLRGTKTWEIRSKNVLKRGRVGIMAPKTGVVLGDVAVVDCIKIQKNEFDQHFHKHRVPSLGALYPEQDYVYAWVVEEPRLYHTPVPVTMKAGQVIWVKVNDSEHAAMMKESLEALLLCLFVCVG